MTTLEPDYWANRNRYKANLRTKKVKEIANDGGQPNLSTAPNTEPATKRPKRHDKWRKAIADERGKR